LERTQNDLKYAKLHIEELTPNSNLAENLEELHERYVAEIQQLNDLLMNRNNETEVMINTFEREREALTKDKQGLQEQILTMET